MKLTDFCKDADIPLHLVQQWIKRGALKLSAQSGTGRAQTITFKEGMAVAVLFEISVGGVKFGVMSDLGVKLGEALTRIHGYDDDDAYFLISHGPIEIPITEKETGKPLVHSTSGRFKFRSVRSRSIPDELRKRLRGMNILINLNEVEERIKLFWRKQ